MKEYIVSLDDYDRDYEEVFIAYIKRQKELIRCKDCKYWNGAGIFCDYEMSGLEEDYCSWAEPKGEQ